MDCRILRQLMLKADGHLVCDDSNGYFINLGVVSTTRGWSVAQVLTGAAYSHIRTSFEEGRIPCAISATPAISSRKMELRGTRSIDVFAS